jgi:hypothetical protein
VTDRRVTEFAAAPRDRSRCKPGVVANIPDEKSSSPNSQFPPTAGSACPVSWSRSCFSSKLAAGVRGEHDIADAWGVSRERDKAVDSDAEVGYRGCPEPHRLDEIRLNRTPLTVSAGASLRLLLQRIGRSRAWGYGQLSGRGITVCVQRVPPLVVR